MTTYKRVREAWQYEITGNRQAGYSVEIKEQKSFKNKQERAYFNKFMKDNYHDRTRVSVGAFAVFDVASCSKITFFPKGKRIKEIDVVAYSPFCIGVDFLVSEKCWQVMEKFNLPPYNKIPVEIDTFAARYFLIGFSRISDRKINLLQSKFYDSSNNGREDLTYGNYEEFDVRNFNRETEYLKLSEYYDFDVISIGGQGVFFSEDLIQEILKENLVGFLITNIKLEC